MVAARYYGDARMMAGALHASSRSAESYDYVNQFVDLTHDFADGERPAPPPSPAISEAPRATEE